MPKWKFRLAADVVIEIQPKLTRSGRLFHWSAIKCDGADAKMFATSDTRLPPWIVLNGRLTEGQLSAAGDLTGYALKARHISWHHGMNRKAGWVSARALRDEIEAAFRGGRFDKFTPSMLGKYCLLCGKGLTDPVSMARFIGPECANTSSASIPWLRDATEES
jgi:Family of unknown function (DUF6011)